MLLIVFNSTYSSLDISLRNAQQISANQLTMSCPFLCDLSVILYWSLSFLLEFYRSLSGPALMMPMYFKIILENHIGKELNLIRGTILCSHITLSEVSWLASQELSGYLSSEFLATPSVFTKVQQMYLQRSLS